MIDRQRLMQTLAGVYGFYDRELTPLHLRIWEEALEGRDMPAIEAAFSRHLRDPDSGRFVPKPADILRQISGSTEDSALVAWGDVLSCARRGGGFSEHACQATREAVAAMGGFSVICRANEEQNGFLQHRFVDLFKAYRQRDNREAIPAPDNVRRLG